MTADDKKKAIAIAAFAVLAAGVLWYNLKDVFISSPAPPPAAAVTAPKVNSEPAAPGVVARPNSAAVVVLGAGAKADTASLQLDPTLKMGPMLVTEALVYTGSGRNIFSASSVPIPIPGAIANARPKTPPPPPMPPMPQGPPPPPPIDLKFFGTATSGSGVRQVFLLHGEDVFLASAGDVVQRRYKVISVAASSIVVEDMANNNRQTLPLLKNP